MALKCSDDWEEVQGKSQNWGEVPGPGILFIFLRIGDSLDMRSQPVRRSYVLLTSAALFGGMADGTLGTRLKCSAIFQIAAFVPGMSRDGISRYAAFRSLQANGTLSVVKAADREVGDTNFSATSTHSAVKQ